MKDESARERERVRVNETGENWCNGKSGEKEKFNGLLISQQLSLYNRETFHKQISLKIEL
jgi:hypothetical protein